MTISSSKLTRNILIAMVAGIFVGIVINASGLQEHAGFRAHVLDGFLGMVGDIFIRSLKLLVVPLVLVSLVCGTAAMEDVRKLGSIGLKTLSLYLLTTCLAISLAMGMALLVKPGAGFEEPEGVEAYVAKEAPTIWQVLTDMFPSNPFQAMADGEMLQVIVFAVLLGIALLVSGGAGKRILAIFHDLNKIVLNLVMILMLFAPFGVFAKLTIAVAVQGWDEIIKMAWYFCLVIVVLVIHAVVVYPALLKLLSGLNPIQFIKNFYKVQVFAFSSASSNATIPITLQAMEKRMGVGKSVFSFTVPLGATINMDGTAIMQGVATIFIAQISGIDLSFSQMLMVVVTATLASIGTAGVPGVGLIMLAMVLNQVGLPVEKISLIIGIDRILDMLRTAVNVTGDAAVTCIVGKSEKQLDTDVYYAVNEKTDD